MILKKQIWHAISFWVRPKGLSMYTNKNGNLMELKDGGSGNDNASDIFLEM